MKVGDGDRRDTCIRDGDVDVAEDEGFIILAITTVLMVVLGMMFMVLV